MVANPDPLTTPSENRNSEINEANALLKLRQTEIRFHIAKLLLLSAVSIFAAVGVIISIRHDNDRTRQQITCVVQAFTSPDKSSINKAVEVCGQ